MIQSVHNVLIGKQVTEASTVDAMQVGDVALFDENKTIIDAADAAEANALYIGVCKGKINVTMPDGSVASKSNVEYSNEIQKRIKSAVVGEYEAPAQDEIEIDMTDATIVEGNRYVIRIVYKDIYEAPGQFTHTYETYAESTTAANVAAALVAKINKHANRRVQASASGAVITLTAMAKDDNEGVNSLNQYSVVSMDATLYETEPHALLMNQPKAVAGATIAKTQGNPGKGYWKQVRDAEVSNMGYKGHVFTGAYPSIEQERMVVADAEYDYIIIENDNLYLSNDNQYVKSTPITTEVYCPSLVGSAIESGIQAFISGVAEESEESGAEG